MKSIELNVQYEEYAINGDADRVIKVNVRDANIAERLEKAMTKIKELTGSVKGYDDITRIDKEIKRALDYAFGSNVSEIAFEGANCITSKGENGKTLLEAFTDAFIPAVEADLKASLDADAVSLKAADNAVSNDVTEEYIRSVEKIGGKKDNKTPFVPYAKPPVDVSGLSESERKTLLAQLLA